MYWLDLLKPKWNSVKTLGQTDFSRHCLRDATVVKNKIVYFGSWNVDKATYVLEEEKGEPRNLEVKSRFTPIDYTRGGWNSSFCTYKEKIYFFPKNKDSEVQCLDVETEQSSLFFKR